MTNWKSSWFNTIVSLRAAIEVIKSRILISKQDLLKVC